MNNDHEKQLKENIDSLTEMEAQSAVEGFGWKHCDRRDLDRFYYEHADTLRERILFRRYKGDHPRAESVRLSHRYIEEVEFMNVGGNKSMQLRLGDYFDPVKMGNIFNFERGELYQFEMIGDNDKRCRQQRCECFEHETPYRISTCTNCGAEVNGGLEDSEGDQYCSISCLNETVS